MIFNTAVTAWLIWCWLAILVQVFNRCEDLKMQGKYISIFIYACGVAASVFGVGKLLMFLWGVGDV